MSTTTIRTIHDLIERLEAVKADIPVRGLSLTEHEQVAWARRAIDALLDRCRDKTDALGWPESEASRFREAVTARLSESVTEGA